jgi:phosphoglycolate phosphatase
MSKPHHFARPILQHFGLDRRFAAVYGPELDGTNEVRSDRTWGHGSKQELTAAGATILCRSPEHLPDAICGLVRMPIK